MNNNPIKQLKVIEVASVLAGPAVGMFFAELGCEVIKLENPQNSDVTRSWKLTNEDKDSNISSYFCAVNYKKKYQTCDIGNSNGLKEFYDLIQDADILIANFRSAENLKVDYMTLSKINPQLIYANITGYGEDNPRGAYDAVLQAETGLMSINGESTDNPIKLPIAFIDILTAHQLKEAILLALYKRSFSNKGCYLPISLYEVAITSLANQATNYLMGNIIPTPTGSLHPNIAPYGETFKCRDGELILLAVGNDKQFAGLCNTLNITELINDSRFINNIARVQNRVALSNILATEFKKENIIYWCSKLEASNVPAGHVKNIAQVFENEVAKKLIVEEEINGVNTRRIKTIAFDLSFLE